MPSGIIALHATALFIVNVISHGARTVRNTLPKVALHARPATRSPARRREGFRCVYGTAPDHPANMRGGSAVGGTATSGSGHGNPAVAAPHTRPVAAGPTWPNRQVCTLQRGRRADLWRSSSGACHSPRECYSGTGCHLLQSREQCWLSVHCGVPKCVQPHTLCADPRRGRGCSF